MRNHTFIYSVFVLVLLLIGCSEDKQVTSDEQSIQSEASMSFTALNAVSSGISFKNVVKEDMNRNSMFYDYFLNGAGLAIGDINNDQLPDIYFAGNDASDVLYINKGDFQFEDATNNIDANLEGWSTGVNMVDINEDGFLDIYVCRSGMDSDKASKKNLLLINDGKGHFTNQATKYGLDHDGQSIHSSFFDYDNDGDLDVWVSNHVNFDGNLKTLVSNMDKSDADRKRYRSRLFSNDNGMFKDVTYAAGVSRESASLGVVTSDLNDDGYIDIYVSNDYDIPDYYFQNNGNGTFTEVSDEKIGHTSFYSMGIDAADIDYDGFTDMVAVDMTPQDHVRNKTLMASMDVAKFNFLYDQLGWTPSYMFNTVQKGVGNGHFSEIANYMGMAQTEWSWAPLIADFDNDGKNDLYISNGYLRDTKDNDFKRKIDKYKAANGNEWNQDVFDYSMKILQSTPVQNKLFKFDGEKYKDESNAIKNDIPTFSNGAAYADLDNDGDLDIVVNNISQSPSILKNDTDKKGFRVKLEGTSGEIYNAKVCIEVKNDKRCHDYYFSRGYQSSVEQVAHFGIGNEKVSKVEVYWMDGTYSIIDNPTENEIIISKSTSTNSERKAYSYNSLFRDASGNLNGAKHKEQKFNDFEKEVLLPQKYSDLGPALATADVNGDGIKDIFLGGSNVSEPQLFIYKDRRFENATPKDILMDKKYEDLGAHFFDFDNDGDMDLYVASGGGGEIEKFPELMADRLYKNDGKGNFTNAQELIPTIQSSTKAVISFDADGDGDLDLLVGGRNVPGQYPNQAKSYYLENNNGIFRDRTRKMMADLPGMITDIALVDIDGDSSAEILISGEWFSPCLFVKENGKYSRTTIKGFEDKVGWWQSILAHDIDGDGDQDIILGNIGENNKFHPSDKKPLGLLASDFDNSGTMDIVLTKKYNDHTVPVRGKECSSEQMPMLNEKFETYESFATSSIEEILGEEIGNAKHNYKATEFASFVLINDGAGVFKAEKLPSQLQYAPLMDASVNADSKTILFVGNKFNSEPETPSYDASHGVLARYGKSGLEIIRDGILSGIDADGDARQVNTITISDKECYLVANNNGPLQLFMPNNK